MFPKCLWAEAVIVTLARWYGTYPCVGAASEYGAHVVATVSPKGVRFRVLGSWPSILGGEQIRIPYGSLYRADPMEAEALFMSPGTTTLKVRAPEVDLEKREGYVVFNDQTMRFIYIVMQNKQMNIVALCGHLSI